MTSTMILTRTVETKALHGHYSHQGLGTFMECGGQFQIELSINSTASSYNELREKTAHQNHPCVSTVYITTHLKQEDYGVAL